MLFIQFLGDSEFGGNVFTVTYDSRKLKITITAESQSEVQLFTDDELRGVNDWQGPAYDSNNLMSANEILGNYTIQSLTTSAFESGIIDLRRIHNVYISSYNLSTFNHWTKRRKWHHQEMPRKNGIRFYMCL